MKQKRQNSAEEQKEDRAKAAKGFITSALHSFRAWALMLLLLLTIAVAASCGGGGGGGDGGAPSGGGGGGTTSVNLPKTGQTTSYATGDDGDLERGAAWSNPRFTVDGTGLCITDNLTGLMWVRTPDSATRIWATALTYANGLSICGYDDWRLPNVNELESLLNAEQADSAAWLNTQGFTNVQASYYWSSSTYAGYPAIAWGVSMGGAIRLVPAMCGLFALDSRLFGDLVIWGRGQFLAATGVARPFFLFAASTFFLLYFFPIFIDNTKSID